MTSINRAEGAALAGNKTWQSAQLATAAGYASQEAGVEAQIAQLQPALDAYISGHLSGYSSQLAGYWQTNDLPSFAKNILQSSGWTDSEIENLRHNLITLGPTALQNLDAEDVAASLGPLFSASSSESELQQAVQLHLQLPDQKVQNVPTADQQRLNNSRNALAASLSSGASVTSLEQQIQSYLADVQNVITKTNNFCALQSDLEFGYSVLVSSGKTALQLKPITGPGKTPSPHRPPSAGSSTSSSSSQATTLPPSVQQQLFVDLELQPSFTTVESQQSLLDGLWQWYGAAAQGSNAQATLLYQQEWTFFTELALGAVPQALATASEIAANPLYNTGYGFGMAIVEGELFLAAMQTT
jgi:hypothetical protein